jgi:UDP-GlcNAc3NAcA epimerase
VTSKKIDILSVIGTRPQYIKIKPIHDYCKANNINHKIIDTKQHYSDNVSKLLIEDLRLNIDISLDVQSSNEIEFICNLTNELSNILRKESPNIVLVYGDTNSTFCAALSAYKLGIPVAHIEAGERCFSNLVPEEINRIFADSVSRFNFCSSKASARNINGIFCGDLEYNLLNNINPKITFENFGVMTIHRQSNCSSDRMNGLFKLCSNIPYDIKFFAHHRIRPFVGNDVPRNVKILDSCVYSKMIDSMAQCKFIITDSGSIQKTSPFFGKNTLVMRAESEWKDTEIYGAAKLEENMAEDIAWLLSPPASRDKGFYLTGAGLPSEIIISKILEGLKNDG